MKWSLSTVLGLVIVAFLAAAAVVACSGGGKEINVDMSYSGKQVDLSLSDSLIVTLPSDFRTDYRWNALVSDDRILRESGHEYVGQVGAGGNDIWTFKALKKGTCTLSMKYVSIQEAEATPAQTFDLTVVIN